jgi:hypothetical protein
VLQMCHVHAYALSCCLVIEGHNSNRGGSRGIKRASVPASQYHARFIAAKSMHSALLLTTISHDSAIENIECYLQAG